MERRVPFQVMLDPEQHQQLRSAAERHGRSIGSLVRESVTKYLAEIAVEDDPLFGLIGLGDDRGPRPYGDVGTEHDAYLADTVLQKPVRKGPRRTVPPKPPTSDTPRRVRRTTNSRA